MNKHHGSSLDSLFDELGEREEVEALAAKKILAVQAEKRRKELNLSMTRLAERMGTSRNQVLRVLDGEDAGITLKMLFRLSRALGMPLHVSFASPPAPVVKKKRKVVSARGSSLRSSPAKHGSKIRSRSGPDARRVGV